MVDMRAHAKNDVSDRKAIATNAAYEDSGEEKVLATCTHFLRIIV